VVTGGQNISESIGFLTYFAQNKIALVANTKIS
jgi:hypothetical protein